MTGIKLNEWRRNRMGTLLTIGVLVCSLNLNGGDKPVPAPAANAVAAEPTTFGDAEYRLGPEDVISVFVWKQPELSTTVVIRPDGKVSLPLIGELAATNKTSVQLQTEITAQMLQYVVDPKVTVIVKEVNSPSITVLGQVQRPDRYRIRQRITALDAIGMAGGFTNFAKRDKVTIIRNSHPDKPRIQLDLKKVVQGGDVYYLEPRDTVYVQ